MLGPWTTKRREREKETKGTDEASPQPSYYFPFLGHFFLKRECALLIPR